MNISGKCHLILPVTKRYRVTRNIGVNEQQTGGQTAGGRPENTAPAPIVGRCITGNWLGSVTGSSGKSLTGVWSN